MKSLAHQSHTHAHIYVNSSNVNHTQIGFGIGIWIGVIIMNVLLKTTNHDRLVQCTAIIEIYVVKCLIRFYWFGMEFVDVDDDDNSAF